MTRQTVNEIIEALAKAEPLALKNEHEIINGKGWIGNCTRCGELNVYYFGETEDGTKLDDGRSYCQICGQKYKRGFPEEYELDEEPGDSRWKNGMIVEDQKGGEE